MRSVLFNSAHGQNGNAVLRDGLANLGPGEFFVSVFIGKKHAKVDYIVLEDQARKIGAGPINPAISK
jgi:hypothetical protein